MAAFLTADTIVLRGRHLSFKNWSLLCIKVQGLALYKERIYKKSQSEHTGQRCKRNCCELKFPAENNGIPTSQVGWES